MAFDLICMSPSGQRFRVPGLGFGAELGGASLLGCEGVRDEGLEFLGSARFTGTRAHPQTNKRGEEGPTLGASCPMP